jgi:dolichol-phosphate mannosyltransferase
MTRAETSASTQSGADRSAEGDWELPAHETTVFAPRLHRYALVIPVINEGERIRNQLKAIAKLAPLVDIIIADGNSTDGSLDADFLVSQSVRALLVKTGSGRLGAQLRMAYAWALHEGYEGIVTMDGNGKDGADAIARFVDMLEKGYDLVQGSRYVAGGQAINTPLDRYLASRLLHAPLLSLAGGKWYTDTTNGFRAYSARFLRDSRVQPFRSIFDRYALLFYLSVRAPQLGYRVIEIPVERRYPAGMPPPSKIAGWRGRFDMLGELAAVARGAFHPNRSRRSRN